jgi:peptide/nickel transport system permease protein
MAAEPSAPGTPLLSEVTFLDAFEPAKAEARSPFRRAVGRIFSNRMGAIGLVMFGIVVLAALSASISAPYDPVAIHPGKELQGPSPTFLMGTDELGRDIFSRVIYGARPSLAVGFVAVVLGSFVGCFTGLLAGYLGGWVDVLIMRIYDAVHAFPAILLGVAVVTVLGPNTIDVAYAVAIASTPTFARVTRSLVLVQRQKDYVLAAKSIGTGGLRIMVRHVFLNCIPPLLVQVTFYMGLAVILEASLSFLGIGTQLPLASWGSMLEESRPYLRSTPLMAVWPGLGLMVLILSLNYVQDALRETLDPRRVNVQ